jgi:hypothetical protein
MPPPELLERAAPASVGTLVLEHLRAEAPMPRHSGPRAAEAHLRARLLEARSAGDTAAEREASVALARLLASRGRDLGVATKLARRALAIAEDPSLRVELAGWLAGLGETAAAAAALRELVDRARPAEAARTTIKIAVLLARAGDAAAAAEALDDAASLDAADAMAVELFGTLSAWAPATVTPEGAAAAYLEAARRRAEAGDAEAAYEDKLRAFEVAPQHPGAAEAMVGALAERGLAGAADEVMRLHIGAATAGGDGKDAVLAHRRRMLEALAEGDAARAVGAMLDAGLEGEIEGDDAARVDEVLSLAGLYELLAFRLEARAERLQGAARGETYEALAKLCNGPLASPDRAVEAWIEALAADPENAAAHTALRDHAASLPDPGSLAEALIRVGSSASTQSVARAAALRELVALADEKMADPALASWALGALAASGHEGDLLRAEKLGLLSRLRHQEDELSAAKRAYEGAATSEARLGALRRIVAVYQGRPAELGEYVAAAAELARALPAERALILALERAAPRSGDTTVLEEVLRERTSASPSSDGTTLKPPRVEVVRARLSLAALARRRGDEQAALEEVLPVLTEAPGHRGAASAALILATRAGRPRERADALMQVAGPAWPALRSVLLSVAADLYARNGAPEPSRRAAEQACEADPTCARAVATLSTTTEATSDRIAAAAIERAMTTVLPRGVWCGRLARSFDRLGEPELAFSWTQRWLALHPGSAEAMQELLRRASATLDAARLADALGWVLAQPRPLAELAEPVAVAVMSMLDLDKVRARTLARRALDVLGPRVPILRARLLELSERAADPGLAIAVLERYLATGTLGAHGSDVLLELARRRTHAGDYDGAARELARAAEARSDPGTVLQHAGDLEVAMREAGAWLGSDGLVAIAEAKAVALAACGPDSAGAAAAAFRELGSLRWDLGEDPRSAEDAFFRACAITPDGGVERYARDLTAFGGVHEAIEALLERADREAGDPPAPGGPAPASRKLRANLLVEAAHLATEHGMPERALLAAASAIESDPTRADAVAWVEKNAHVEGGVAVLDRTYELLAGAALGCFGRRAAHHRAARQLEKRGATDLALKHAAACFEAVPSEGTSYVLLTRLAERAGDPGEAVRAIERVAEAGPAGMRPTWLKRAATMAGPGEEGVRTRFDLLLRALIARPDPDTVAEVAAAVREVSRLGGDDVAAADMVRLRCERALSASMRRLDGPDGARAAVAMARLALELGAKELAFAALDRAMEADGDIDEFTELTPRIADLTEGREAAEAWLARLRANADKPYSSVGRALLHLGSRVARALGDTGARAALLITAVRRFAQDEGQLSPGPDVDALVEEADIAAHEHGDPDMVLKLDAAFPPAQRALAQLRIAEERERGGRESEAISGLERALGSRQLDADNQARASARLQLLLGRSGRDTDAEALLRTELARGSLPPAAHGRVAHDLADFLLRRDRKQAAFEVLAGLASEGGPPDPDLLAEMRGLARATDVLGRYADVLASAVGRAEGAAGRLEILRELGPIYAELGETEKATGCYEAIAALDPADIQALELLERAADERGDHPVIAALLGMRIALTAAGDKKRMLRLRRAAVLEQRLGLLDEAASELDALLVEAPNDPSALRFLADVQERRGVPLAAAALLARLEDLAHNSDEKAEYGLRAASAYLAGSDVDEAERTLERIAPIAPREGLLSLRVELWRTTGDARALAEALEQLAAASGEPAERRAGFLLEAARASAAIGDDTAALERARRALKLAPNLAEAVLEARRLEYRGGGAGTPREAQAAVDELTRIEGRLAGSEIELHAFLLAEELDVIQGGGAGMRELSRRHAEVGPLPLIALGMAERLVRGKNFDAALPLFTHALSGDLRGLRSRGRVALAAAEAAASAEEFQVAAELLDLAAGEPETQLLAQRKQLELAATIGDPSIARQALMELLRQTTGLDRARVLLQLGRLVADTDPDEAARLFAEAAPLATADRTLPSQIAEATALLDAQRAASEAEPEARGEGSGVVPDAEPEARRSEPEVVFDAEPEARASPPEAAFEAEPEVPAAPLEIAAELEAETPPPAIEAELEARVAPPMVVDEEPPSPALVAPAEPPPIVAPAEHRASPAPRIVAVLSPTPPLVFERGGVDLQIASPAAPADTESAPAPPTVNAEARPSSVVSAGSATEERLAHDLASGSFEAGEQLVALYGTRAERAPDVLAVRRQQAMVRLGDRTALQRLREAAVLDGNPAYARSIEHVLHVWDADGPPPAPPLAVQRLAPDLVAALLFRSMADSAVHEALALVLDTGLYRRDVGQYQLTGVARVQPTGGTTLGEVFGVVARFLGQQRSVLFHQRASGPPSFKVALLSPPAIVLSGDIRDETPELRYLLGAALAGAMPEHALVNALGEEGLRTLLDALHAAFGPVANLPRGNAAVARLGQNLWQLVPPRADRRLRELCGDLSLIQYDAAVAGTRQAMRRSGLFASGNLGVALAQLGSELGIPLAEYRASPDGLAEAAAAHPEVADLVRLAIRTELAEARWSPATAQERRRVEGGPRSQRWDVK